MLRGTLTGYPALQSKSGGLVEGLAAYSGARGSFPLLPLGAAAKPRGSAGCNAPQSRKASRIGKPFCFGVLGGTRTLDNQNHNLALYQLNYEHRIKTIWDCKVTKKIVPCKELSVSLQNKSRLYG